MQVEISQAKRNHVRTSEKRAEVEGASRPNSLLIRIASFVPYPVGVWVMRRMSRSWLLRQTLFRPYLRRLEPILARAQQPVDHKRAVRRHLMGKGYRWLYSWRLSMAGRADCRLLAEWFPISGLDRLERARATGRGVLIINSHFGGGRFVPLVLARMGIELLSLERVDGMKRLGIRLPDNLQVVRLKDSFLARAVFQAERALKQGKVVHLAADGHQGNNSFVINFLGRDRRFTTGFAELAVNTGAVVLPVFAPFDENGRVGIEFLEPLESGPDSLARGEQIVSLVRQYVRRREQRWSQDPGNVLKAVRLKRRRKESS